MISLLCSIPPATYVKPQIPLVQRCLLPLLLLVALATSPLYAQSGSVEGRVLDLDGAPLSGATVRIPELKGVGAVVRKDGGYRINDVQAGTYIVMATMVGRDTGRLEITLPRNGTVTASFRLAPRVTQTQQVEVIAQRRVQPQNDTRASVTKIDPREAKFLPGGAEDVMRSLRSLPGVVAPNDFSTQLVIRGSGPDQNLIVMDDMEVFNPYRLYGFVSMFNPETVSDITLLSGGFPAKYGDRLSAVLDITNREGSPDGVIAGKINLSVTNANVVLEGKLPDALNGSWILSGRRTYYDLILGPIARSAKLVDGDVAFPNFLDLQFKAVVRPWSEHSFVINGLTSRDATELVSGANRKNLDSFSINDQSFNSLVGGEWRFTPDETILSKTIASWYQNTGETEFGGEGGSRLLYGDVTRDSLSQMIRSLPQAVQDSLRARGINPDNPPALGLSDGNATFTFTKYSLANETAIFTPNHLVEVGAGVDIINTAISFSVKRDSLLKALTQARGRNAPDSIVSTVDHYRAHLYAQDRISVGNILWIQPGVRFDYYKIIDRSYVSPRISASLALDPLTTLRAAYGHYYQSPGYEKLFDRQTFFDLTSPEIANLRAERAIHYVIGIDRMLSEEWKVKGEGYYKKFDDLIVQQKLVGTRYISTPVPGGDPRYAAGWTTPIAVTGDSLTSVPVNDATGAAWGVEFLLQKVGSVGDSPLSGWIGYTLAWANRYRDGVTFPFNFDQRHTVNVVANYRATNWLELGANFQYGSGFPFTAPTGFRPLVVSNVDTSGERRPSVATNIFGEALFTIDRGGVEQINSARLPAYHRLDVRGTFYADWWGLDWAIYLDIVNVYNHTNLLSRSYSVDKETVTLKERDVSMLPILPTLGVSVRFR